MTGKQRDSKHQTVPSPRLSSADERLDLEVGSSTEEAANVLDNVLRVGERLFRNPRQFWSSRRHSTESYKDVYSNFLLAAAAVPAAALAVGSIFAGNFFGGLLRLPVGYGVILASAAGLAFALEHLAVRLGGRVARIQALQLVAYSCTPAYLGGLTFIVADQNIRLIGGILALYSFHLLRLGVPLMCDIPKSCEQRFTAYAFSVVFVWGLLMLQLSLYLF